MIILIFEEFNNKYNIENEAMSNIEIESICRDIILIPIEVVVGDRTPDSVNETNFNIFVKLHPTGCTHWVLIMRREGGAACFFDSFDVETPPIFLQE